MVSLFLKLSVIYAGFVSLGTLLALARRWVKPGAQPTDVWKKYPIYLVLNIVFLIAIWPPVNWHTFGLLLALIGAGASWELSNALKVSPFECYGLPIATAGLVLTADWLNSLLFIRIWMGLVLVLLAITTLINYQRQLGKHLIVLAGTLGYIPLCLSTFIQIRHGDSGVFSAILLYGIITTNDAFSQVIGQLFGHRKITPTLSPSKTVEGALGGLLFAILFSIGLHAASSLSIIQGIIIGSVTALAGLIGDLVESGWKRALGIKDFSNLMSANGGVLDRFDSLILAAPIYFLLFAG